MDIVAKECMVRKHHPEWSNVVLYINSLLAPLPIYLLGGCLVLRSAPRVYHVGLS